tara:strand:+ start:233 stop:454 length:222 start_codon:yes stop_codon:yes gene_type:complete
VTAGRVGPQRHLSGVYASPEALVGASGRPTRVCRTTLVALVPGLSGQDFAEAGFGQFNTENRSNAGSSVSLVV